MAEHWLHHARVQAYGRMAFGISALGIAAWFLNAHALLDAQGTPLGADFITFWAASHLGLDGQAAAAYNPELLFQVERLAVPALQKRFAWFYPPSFFLLVLPLATMPYLFAYASFVLATLTPYVLIFRRILSAPLALCCLFGFPGLWVNILHGQNAFLTAALAAAALLALERRPVLAGVCIGMLAIKPHMALLFPVALLACGAWRAMLSAALTGAALLVLGTLVLGGATLTAFLDSLQLARQALEQGGLPWYKMPSLFAQLRMAGLPPLAAYGGQAIGALCAAAAVWRLWRGPTPLAVRASALMLATFLVSPYVFDYDLAWLAFPIAWLTAHGLQHGWQRGERELLLAAWLLPALGPGMARWLMIQPAPLVLAWLLLITLRRSARAAA
jgi:hypothetical protein